IPEEKFADNNRETKRILHDYIWNALQLKEVNNKFYKGIVQHFETLTNAMINLNDKSEDDAKQFSSRLIGRLLFVWFLRKMDIVNNMFSYFDTERRSSTEYYREELKILFFEILNTPIENRKTLDTETPYLNGGLFEVKENDYFYQELIFPEDYFKSLYNHFDEFNFTTDESSADYELIAVDPEMLGQVFESLLDSQLNEEGSSERHDTGSFYTPREIVNYMCKESLRQYLYNQVDNVSFNDGIDKLLDMSDAKFMEMKSSSTVDLWGVNTKNVLSKIDSALNDVKIIDPAVGSGAFPIGMMQLMLKLYERIKPMKVFNSYKMKLAIVKNNIYGVDNQPMATEITRLRAWLSIIVEDANKKNVEPLPNLDFKFISANSIVKLDQQNNLWSDPELDNKLNEIRAKYFNARKPEKKKEWKDYYFSLTQNTGLFDDKRTQQLKSFNTFSNTSAADFYESKIMFGIEEGFDIVIGNPPYLLEGKAPKYNFENISYYQGKMDIWYSFACVGIDLLKDKGILSFIATDKWFTNTGASLMRNKIIAETRLLEIKDFSNNMIFDSATVQTMILTLQKDDEIDNYSFSYSKMDKKNTSLSSFIQSEGQGSYLQPIINRDKYRDQFLVFSKHDNILNKIAECSSYLLPSEVANGIHPHYDFVN